MRKKYHRVGFTAVQSAELWDRWRRGESLNSIGREFGKPSSCIFNHIRPTGGISPVSRRRSGGTGDFEGATGKLASFGNTDGAGMAIGTICK